MKPETPQRKQDGLAPCVAVIGPANAGKTTILHQLDEKLSQRLESVLVIKGNPDGNGRYQYHAPQLRNDPEFKKSIKGEWGAGTIDRICEWVTHGRRNLSLALLDFGGRHDSQTAAGNARMLQTCSHYLVVSRDSDAAGAKFWDEIGKANGLQAIGWMRSLAKGGPPPAILPGGGDAPIEATFQVDVRPEETINDSALRPLLDTLTAMSVPANRSPYVNLHFPTDWEEGHIPDVRGQASKIRELAVRTGAVVLGGARAPVWAYLAGLRCALSANPGARVFFYDPRQPERLVEIPARRGEGPADFPEGVLALSWRRDGERAVLECKITTGDKWLPSTAAQNMAGAPEPPAMPQADGIFLSVAGPMWLFGTYARWLAQRGVRGLGSWDARSGKYIEVWPD